MLALQRITPPLVEPIQLIDAKAHLRVDISDDDDLIAALITAARDWCENYTGRSLITQEWLLQLDGFPGVYQPYSLTGILRQPPYSFIGVSPQNPYISIDLPRPLLQSVKSIKYYDQNNTLQTLDPATYYIDAVSEPGRIAPAPGQYWPATVFRMGAIQIDYLAGYSDDSSKIPVQLIQAMKLVIGHLYENREDVVLGAGGALEVPKAAEYLAGMYRMFTF